MTRIILRLSYAISLAAFGATLTTPTHAYSYAVEAAEPLLDGRETLFQAADSGFWMAAKITLNAMRAEIEYLDENEDLGLTARFDAAVTAKDATALRAAFNRAAADEIIRRLNGARDNIDDYAAAKLLVVAANRFYTAVAADLDPKASQIIAAQMIVAIDAVGNPGLLGVGSRPADPAAFDASRAAITSALRQP